MFKSITEWLNQRNLNTSDPQAYHAAVSVLVKKGDLRAVEPLTQHLGHADIKIRKISAWALGELKDPRATQALIPLLDDASVEVSETAAHALGHLGDRQAIPALIQALGSADHSLRKMAAKALARLGEPRWHAWVTGTDDDFVNLSASGERRALVPLLRALDNQLWHIRRIVVQGLGRLGDKAALPHLQQALMDKNGEVRSAAAEALAQLKAKS